MAKVEVKGLSNFKKSVHKRIENAAERALNNYAKEEIKIKKHMMRGYQPFSDEKYPSLKPITKKYRKYLAKYNPTHEQFKPNKSNVTITGQLVNSFQIIVKGTIGSGVTAMFLFKDNVRRKYLNHKGKPMGNSLSNAELARYLEESGHLNPKPSRKFIENIKKIFMQSFERFYK